MKFRLVLAALVGAACFLSSCSDDEDPMTPPPDEPSAVRNRPDSLLTSWFERAYETQNRDLYSEMLDSAFTFRFLEEDADSFELELGLDGNGAWNKMKDLTSATNMFNDATVSNIILELLVSANLPYAGGDCIGCRELHAGVDLHVFTNPPGEEPRTLDIVSDQTFIVKPDPADTTLWVIFRQVDQLRPPRGDGGRGPSSNEELTWGQLKAEFF